MVVAEEGQKWIQSWYKHLISMYYCWKKFGFSADAQRGDEVHFIYAHISLLLRWTNMKW